MRGKTLQDVLLAVIMIIPVGRKRRREGGGMLAPERDGTRLCERAHPST